MVLLQKNRHRYKRNDDVSFIWELSEWICFLITYSLRCFSEGVIPFIIYRNYVIEKTVPSFYNQHFILNSYFKHIWMIHILLKRKDLISEWSTIYNGHFKTIDTFYQKNICIQWGEYIILLIKLGSCEWIVNNKTIHITFTKKSNRFIHVYVWKTISIDHICVYVLTSKRDSNDLSRSYQKSRLKSHTIWIDSVLHSYLYIW